MAGKKRVKFDGEIDQLSRNRTWHDMLHPESYMYFPGQEQIRDRLKYTLLAWSADPKTIEYLDFFFKYKIPRKTFMDWVAKYPDLAEAWDMAKLQIASRRMNLALFKKIDKDLAVRDLHIYDEEYDGINRYHVSLKTEAEQQKPVSYVVHYVDPKVDDGKKEE